MLYLKAFHIVGIVVWFSGLFYIGRLFVYHKEAELLPEEEKKILIPQYTLMEKRLWYAITWPGFWVSMSMGIALLYYFGLPSWLYAKLAFVFILVLYHLQCARVRKKLEQGMMNWSGKQLRMFNEVPSILLIAIVFIVVLKNQVSLPTLLASLFGVMIVFGLIIQWFFKKRKPDQP